MPRRRMQHRVGHRTRCAHARIRAGAGHRRARAGRCGRVPGDARRAHRGARDGEHGARGRLPGGDHAQAARRHRHGARVSLVRRVGGRRLDGRPDRRGRDSPLSGRDLRRGCGGRASRHARARLHALPGARAGAAQSTGTRCRDRRFGGDDGGCAGGRPGPAWRAASRSGRGHASRCWRPMAPNALRASGPCFSAGPWRRRTSRSSTSRLRRRRQAPDASFGACGQGSRSRVAMPAGR